MKGVILVRNITPDESYLLHVLMSSGKLQKLKIPGIQKSKKRSSFFYAPGTIRDFTYHDNGKDILYVREDTLAYSPINENVSYEDLAWLSQAIYPSGFFLPSENLSPFYDLYEYAFSRWISLSLDMRIAYVNTILLRSLTLFGYFHDSYQCENCNDVCDKNGYYILDSGFLCHKCYRSEMIPAHLVLEQSFIRAYYDWPTSIYPLEKSVQENHREKIKKYLAGQFK